MFLAYNSFSKTVVNKTQLKSVYRINLLINFHSTKDVALEMSSLLLELAEIIVKKAPLEIGDGHD